MAEETISRPESTKARSREQTGQAELRRRLVAAIEELNASRDELNTLTCTLTHEIRNALAGVNGALSVVADRLPSESADHTVLMDSRERLLGLDAMVEELHEYALPLKPNFSPQPLRPQIEAAVCAVGEDAPDLALPVTGAEPRVLCDPDLLRRALFKVFRSAVQAVAGRVPIVVRVVVDRQLCRIQVREQGDNPASALHRLFDPFFTANGRGAGLALAVARRLIAGHGGTLEALPDARHKSIVEVALPVYSW